MKFDFQNRMPWQSVNPPAPLCPSCKAPVFNQEAYMVADRKPYHRTCLKCDRNQVLHQMSFEKINSNNDNFQKDF